MLAEYDVFSAEHNQKRVNKGKDHVLHFSSTVCEEFVDLFFNKSVKYGCFRSKKAKYYSVSVDSTPAITNIDHLPFQELRKKGKVLSGCHHYTEETSRQQRRRVQLNIDGGSENTPLDPLSRFKVESHLPIDQMLLPMKTCSADYNCLRRFLYLAELNTAFNSEIEESAKTLLNYNPDDLKESLQMVYFSEQMILFLPELMVYFSALQKLHHLTANAKKFKS